MPYTTPDITLELFHLAYNLDSIYKYCNMSLRSDDLRFGHAAGSSGSSRPYWKSWTEVRLKLFDLPKDITTRELWKCFNQQGKIVRIEIYVDKEDRPDGNASLTIRCGI